MSPLLGMIVRRLRAPLLIASLTLAACWKVIFHGEFTLLSGSDMARAYYPYFDVAAYWLKRGVFLLWNPYVYAGKPAMGEPQPGLYYPLNWLFMLVPSRDGGINPDAMQALLVVDFFLAAYFARVLARSLGLSETAAMTSGVAFAFGGFTVQVYGYVNKLGGFVWLPLVFCFFRRALDAPEPRARRRAILAAGAALALAFLPGHHIPPLHASLLLLFYGVYRAAVPGVGRRARFQVPAALIAVAAVAALLTAVQWLPSAEWARKVYRWIGEGPPVVWGQKVPYSSLGSSGNLNPQDALSLLLPYVSTANNLYVGATVLFLAATGLLFGRGRDARFFGLAAVLYFFLSWGWLSASHGWVNTFVPGVWFAREVFHYLVVFELCVALLAGWGLDALTASFAAQPPRPIAVFVRRAGWGMAALVPGALALAAALHLLRDVPLDHPYLTALGALVAYLAVLGVLLFALYTRRIAPARFGLMVAALVMLDLGSEFARRVPPKRRPAGEENTYVRELWKKPPAAQFLIAARRDEIFRVDDPEECFQAEFGDVWRLESTMGHGATALIEYFALRSTGWGPMSNASELLNVRYFPSRTAIPGSRRVFEGADGIDVYRNERAAPRVFLVPRYRVFARDGAMLRWIESPLFEPRETVLLRPGERAALGLSAELDEEDGLNLEVLEVRTAAAKRGERLEDPRARQQLLFLQPRWGWSIGDEVRLAARPRARVEHCFATIEYDPAAEGPSRLEFSIEGPSGRRKVPLQLDPRRPGAAELEWARAEVDLGPLEAGETLIGLERTASSSAKLAKLRIGTKPATAADPGDASIESYEPNRLAVRVRSRTPSLLVLGEVHYPGWRARLDGRAAPLATGNCVLRVAAIPPGEHTLELRFRSTTFLVGLAVTLVALAGWIGLLVSRRA